MTESTKVKKTNEARENLETALVLGTDLLLRKIIQGENSRAKSINKKFNQ